MARLTKAQYVAKYRNTIDEASRRMKELRAAGELTPALQMLQQDWTRRARVVRFNPKMSYADLEKSVSYAKRFINAKSSTVSGMEQIRIDRETRLGDIVKSFGAEGLAPNRTELFRVLGSIQFQRARGEIDSEVLITWANKLIASGKSASTIKGMMTRTLRTISEKDIDDPTEYIRERWDI